MRCEAKRTYVWAGGKKLRAEGEALSGVVGVEEGFYFGDGLVG